MDQDSLIILLNMSGWIIVGYLIRDYFQETKKIKQQLYEAMEHYNEIKIEQKLQNQRLTCLEHSIEEIVSGIEHIKNTLEDSNRNLIHELKDEIRELKK